MFDITCVPEVSIFCFSMQLFSAMYPLYNACPVSNQMVNTAEHLAAEEPDFSLGGEQNRALKESKY